MGTWLNLRRGLIRIVLTACVLAGSAATAAAQSKVRVTHDETAIWASDFRTKAAVVPAGTILTVIRRRDDWYEVLVPQADGGSGYVFKSSVDIETTSRPPVAESAEPPRAFGIVGVAQFGYVRFAAEESFRAILGRTGGASFGGGAEVRLAGGFLNASIERFNRTGQRVVIVDGEVFKLGIPDTVTVTPVTVTAGWRLVGEHATFYGGAGVGRILYQEQTRLPGTASSGCTCRTTSTGDVVEKFDSRFASYHMLGGVEIRNGWVATAFELQYTRAPHTIGAGGASAAFQETNLGSLAGRIKVLVGR